MMKVDLVNAACVKSLMPSYLSRIISNVDAFYILFLEKENS